MTPSHPRAASNGPVNQRFALPSGDTGGTTVVVGQTRPPPGRRFRRLDRRRPRRWVLVRLRLEHGVWRPGPEAARRRGELGPEIDVAIDVAPECAANALPLDGAIDAQVILYGEASWDLADLRMSTLRFGGAMAQRVAIEDVDADTYDDLRMFFAPESLTIDSAAQTSWFNGILTTGRLLWAEAAVDPGSYVDTDADGVIDPCDACASTPPGTPVGEDGCP